MCLWNLESSWLGYQVSLVLLCFILCLFWKDNTFTWFKIQKVKKNLPFIKCLSPLSTTFISYVCTELCSSICKYFMLPSPQNGCVCIHTYIYTYIYTFPVFCLFGKYSISLYKLALCSLWLCNVPLHGSTKLISLVLYGIKVGC